MSSGTMKSSKNLGIGLAALWLLCLIQLVAQLVLNQGNFMFTLDDPYIHLALAENLWQHGHYGVNLGEFSAPSSSVIWPLLIAPFNAYPIAVLVLNVVLASVSMVGIHRVISLWPLSKNPKHGQRLGLLFLLAFILGSNQVGLIFLGMEHSLQLACASYMAYALLLARREGQLRWWVWPLVVFAPLVRYEMLALDLAVFAFAWTQRQRKPVIVSLVLITVLLAAFSFSLTSMGLGVLPSSIRAKVGYADDYGLLRRIASQVKRTLIYPQGVAMLVGVGWLLTVGLLRQKSKPLTFDTSKSLGLAVIVACCAHFAVGKYDWFYRYEVYVWTFFLLCIGDLWLTRYQAWFAGLFIRHGMLRVALVGGAAIFASCILYVRAIVLGPIGSNNIYEQQYQMHRLVQEHYPVPIAVNDLGWVAYRNDNYVLDLWGLGSERARKARFSANGNSDWMQELALEHEVRMVMVYDDWFEDLPSSWAPMGKLTLSRKRVTPASKDVVFYVTDPKYRAEFCQATHEWAAGLPPGVVFESKCGTAVAR